MERLLENRVRYFLSSRYRGRQDVREALGELRRLGRLVLIGGMLRDIALFGNREFKSDLDLVIAPYDLRSFERHMTVIGARVNRFGGYELPSKRWQIDVWPLERTWAHVHGHVKVCTVGDLRNVTFFKCDAILYDLTYGKLRTKPDYFNELERRVLEVNLQPNPNPAGNAVRALRYGLLKGFRWGPNLARFMAETIDSTGWDQLVESEIRSFGTQFLNTLMPAELNAGLIQHLSDNGEEFFTPSGFQRSHQLDLPYLH